MNTITLKIITRTLILIALLSMAVFFSVGKPSIEVENPNLFIAENKKSVQNLFLSEKPFDNTYTKNIFKREKNKTIMINPLTNSL